MQTSPVLNQANPLLNQAPAKASDADTSITPFNQVLSREIADRGNAADAQKADGPEAAAKPAADAGKTKDAKAADDAKPEDDDGKSDKSAGAAQASADMLALVAHLAPAVPQDVAADAKALPADGSAIAGLAKNIDRIGAQPSGGTATPADIGKARKPDAGLAATDHAGRDASAQASDRKALKPEEIPGAANGAAKPATEHAAAADPQSAAARTGFAAELNDAKAAPAAAAAVMQPLQQAALHLASQAGTPAADKLTPPVGTPAWDQALGQKVVWMVAGDRQSASLTLNPPDLGPLQVVLNVSNSTAHASFTAAQPEVRQALEAALPKLRDMLGDAGIQLGQATVSGGSPQQQNPFDRQAAQAAQPLRADGGETRVDAPLHTARVRPAASGLGMVDTFV